MADVKISELPTASTVSDSDIVVINQSGTTKTAARSLIKNPGTVTSVTAGTGLSGGTITGSGTIALVTPVAVANGGTGVAASSGANSVVLRDANQNVTVNSVIEGYSTITASGTQVVLTVASAPSYLVTGSGGQTIKLPDATTLQNGVVYLFNNNQSSGAISVNNNSGTLVASIPSGGFTAVSLLDNSIAAGSWERHEQAPSNVTWSTNTLDYPGSITSATWNGNAVAINRGGTGASTQQGALNNISGTQTAGYHFRSDGTNVSLQPMSVADVTAGTLAVTYGGTGAATVADATKALGGMQVAQIRHSSTIVLATASTLTGASWSNVTNPTFLAYTNTSAQLVIGMSVSAAGFTTAVITGFQTGTGAPGTSGTVTMSSSATAAGSGTVSAFNSSQTTLVSSSVFAMDGRTMVVGDIFVATSQTATAQNGPWKIDSIGTGFNCSRPSWFTGTLVGPILVQIQYGSGNTGTIVSVQSSAAITTGSINIGTDPITALIAVGGRLNTAGTSSNTFSGPQTFRATAAGAGQCPIIFQAGVLMTTPQAHAVEWDGTSMFLTTSAAVRTTNVVNTVVPATSTSAGAVGQIAVDNTNNWLYVCTAANVWKRVLLATF